MRSNWLWMCVVSGVCQMGYGADNAEDSEQEKKVTVTGSLIKKHEQEGPAPILTLTAEDLARLGHTNLYEALLSLTAQTGSLLEGDQFPNGFTSAAQALNLRGFGPGRTLVLVNGQRLALNPTPYQSEANFFNFATIPTIAIERVDVLTDGASAIYGSDAIAGVINVILREEFDSNELALTYGTTAQGGGQSLKLSGGNSFRDQDYLLTIGYQWEQRDPIYAEDRAYLYDVNPDILAPSILAFDRIDGQFEVPGLDACDAHPSEIVNTMIGSFCTRGTRREENLRNQRDTLSLFTHFEVPTTHGKWFSDLILWDSETKTRSFPLYWEGYVNDAGGNENYVFREFSFAETGNQDRQYDEQNLSITSGFSGLAAAFDYQFTLTYSDYDSKETSTQLRRVEMATFFPTAEAIFDVYQPNDFADALGERFNDANSKSINVSFWMSGEGLSINDRPSKYAFITEWNKTRYRIDTDETSRNFDWFGFGGSSGRGSRDRMALGFEWLFPVMRNESFGQWDLTVATRFDDYQDESNVGSANTWKLASQWRPSDGVAINTVYSTSFRAPDMHYLFADPTVYFTDVIDIYQCVNVDGNTYEDCENNLNYVASSTQVIWAGNLGLQEENGNSTTFGLAFDQIDNLSLSLDWYEIELENQVGLQLESQYLLWEAQCEAGVNFRTGDPVNPNSAICQDANARIFRDGFGVFALINSPVNRALRRQQGVEFSADWFYSHDELGSFAVAFKYSKILKTEIQEIASEPSTYDGSYEDDPRNGEVQSRSNLALSWGMGDWTTALSFYRKGSRVSFDGNDRLPAWTLANLIIEKELSRSHSLSLVLRNAFDKKPPIDTSRIEWPYYDRSQYDAIGRELYLEYRYAY